MHTDLDKEDKEQQGTPKVKQDSSIPDYQRSARNPRTIGNQQEVSLPLPHSQSHPCLFLFTKTEGLFFIQESDSTQLLSLCGWSQCPQSGQHPRDKFLTRWEGVRGSADQRSSALETTSQGEDTGGRMGHLTTFLGRLLRTVHEKSPHLKPAALAILRKLCRGGQLSRAMPSGRRRIMREGVQQRVQEAFRATNTKEPSPCSHQVPSTSTVQLSTQIRPKLGRNFPATSHRVGGTPVSRSPLRSVGPCVQSLSRLHH